MVVVLLFIVALFTLSNSTDAFLLLRAEQSGIAPAMLPLLHLDRIYVRGFKVAAAQVHKGKPWSMLSDHLAVSAELSRI